MNFDRNDVGEACDKNIAEPIGAIGLVVSPEIVDDYVNLILEGSMSLERRRQLGHSIVLGLLGVPQEPARHQSTKVMQAS